MNATNELFHKMPGTIDTPEKFEARRLELAQNVWRVMKATDPRECRNCHECISMDFSVQGRRASVRHQKSSEEGKTCIDCHRGSAHRLPAGLRNEFGDAAPAAVGRGWQPNPENHGSMANFCAAAAALVY